MSKWTFQKWSLLIVAVRRRFMPFLHAPLSVLTLDTGYWFQSSADAEAVQIFLSPRPLIPFQAHQMFGLNLLTCVHLKYPFEIVTFAVLRPVFMLHVLLTLGRHLEIFYLRFPGSSRPLQNLGSTRKQRLKHEARKCRKRSTQNSKPVCSLETWDSPSSSHHASTARIKHDNG